MGSEDLGLKHACRESDIYNVGVLLLLNQWFSTWSSATSLRGIFYCPNHRGSKDAKYLALGRTILQNKNNMTPKFQQLFLQ